MQSSISHASLKTRPAAVIETTGLIKVYRDKTRALDGFEVQVPRGEIFGLVGPDGSGKTTALEIIAGVLQPTTGEVRVLGREPRLSRKSLAYVTQENFLFPDLTVSENIWYEAGLRSVEPQVYSERQKYSLDRMGLSRFVDHPAGQLSGGMKQKLALCCALISEPELLILDEPSTGLDPLSRRELWHTLHELVREEMTILVATPSLEEANGCTLVAFMNEGKVFDSGQPQKLQKQLGVGRLELLFADATTAEKANELLSKNHSTNITDVHSFGSMLEVLAKNPSAAKNETANLLSSKSIEAQSIDATLPTLENVFITRLKEMGSHELSIRHMPRLKSDAAGEHDHQVLIKVSDLSKKYPTSNGKGKSDLQAVRNVGFETRAGEIYGLLGANGAGKTTTIKMLCGLAEPTSGQVEIAGESGDLRSVDVRRKIGYMSQKFTLYAALTVVENLKFYSAIYEIPRAQRAEKVEWVLDVFGLQEVRDMPIRNLPRGWKQRIAFGAAILHEPRILFLDEPTAGVDPVARRQLWQMITNLSNTGTAILVSTHYLEEAEYCHRLGLMSGGSIVAQGTPAEVRQMSRGRMIELRCDNVEPVLDSLLGELGARGVSRDGDTVRIWLDSKKRVPLVKQAVSHNKSQIKGMREVQHNLEEAFISILTGSEESDSNRPGAREDWL